MNTKKFLRPNKIGSKKIIWIVFGVLQILQGIWFCTTKYEVYFSPTYYQGTLKERINQSKDMLVCEVDGACKVKGLDILKMKSIDFIFQGRTWSTVNFEEPSIIIRKNGIKIYSQKISEDCVIWKNHVDLNADSLRIRGELPQISLDIYRKQLWSAMFEFLLFLFLMEIGILILVISKMESMQKGWKICWEKVKGKTEEYKHNSLLWVIPMWVVYFICSERIIKLNATTQYVYIIVSAVFLGIITKIIMNKTSQSFICEESVLENMKERKWYVLGGGLIFCLYAYNLTVNELHGDEAYHYLSARGFLETGKFVQWDYVKNVPYSTYTRAWPYTFCIAGFFFLFGESLLAARMVSVLLGVVFWVILFRCIKWKLNDVRVAFFMSVIISVNPVLIDIFRTIRMYALALPLALLLIIYVYKFLVSAEEVKEDATTLKMIYPYSIKYTILTLVLVVLNYLVMPNVLIIVGGVVLWIFYKGIMEKKKQYRSSVIIIITGGIAGVLMVLCKNRLPEMLQSVIIRIQYHITWVKEIHIKYLWENLKYPAGYVLGTLAFLTMVVYLLHTKNKKEKDIWLFLMFIEITTIAFFALFTERGFAIRYTFYLIPISSFIVLYGMYLILRRNGKLGKQIYAVIVLLSVTANIGSGFGAMYQENNDYSRFSEAYEKISKVVDSRSINLCAAHYRSNYLAEYFDEVNYLEYTQEKYLTLLDNGKYEKTDVEELIDYSVEYSSGVLSIEKEKFDFTTDPMRKIAEGYMDKITGTGLDDTKVESYLYDIYHRENSSSQDILDGMISFGKGILSYNIDQENSKMYIQVDADRLPEASHFLCINTWCGDTEEVIYKSYQLVIPQDAEGQQVYCLDWNLGEKDQFDMDPSAGIYTYDQSFKEIEL